MRIAKLTSASYRIQRQQDKNGSCHVISDVFAKPVCEKDISGDFLSTSGSSMMTQWTMLKILHYTENELILYWCTRENEGGSCEIEGVRVDLLSRSPTYKPSSNINIEEKLNMVCLESKNLIDVESSLHSACHPETLPPPPSPPPVMPVSSCAVDVLPKTNVDIERIAGYWYEVASPPPEPLFPLRNMVLYYHPVGTQHIKMIISGQGPDGKCKGPLYGDFKVRCTDKPDGRFLGRLNKTGLWTWTTMQIMYTDYDHVAIAYSCMNEREDGSCNPASAKAHILSRQTTLDETRRTRMNGIILSACLSPLNDHIHDGICKSKVAEGLEMLKQKVNAAPA
ncbi:uncharacterized protein LOC126808499 [Patella vulgata]|uniref:uncharacterized protein LOC126808499 n=1 Tax=Patella vulgata TaxID=6465 RepID=UPI00217F4FA2|nr:uncharacterized protein LOC126808499 [Patella vulgata]